MTPFHPDQLTLGDLLALLACRDPDHRVWFDFCSFQPTRLGSYRGFYEQLALGHEESTMNGPLVRGLLVQLRNAVGATFHGYKGGAYVMGPSTPLWVANPGDAGSTAIVGLADCSWATVILTRWLDV